MAPPATFLSLPADTLYIIHSFLFFPDALNLSSLSPYHLSLPFPPVPPLLRPLVELLSGRPAPRASFHSLEMCSTSQASFCVAAATRPPASPLQRGLEAPHLPPQITFVDDYDTLCSFTASPAQALPALDNLPPAPAAPLPLPPPPPGWGDLFPVDSKGPCVLTGRLFSDPSLGRFAAVHCLPLLGSSVPGVYGRYPSQPTPYHAEPEPKPPPDDP
ncbi:hypothetical protein TeGR_g4939, partial [Tetraparma gracilis]